jgi:hypothetical protein
MNSKQENKYSMYLAFKKYIDTQTTITNALPNFAASLTVFNTALSKIETSRNAQETDSSGTTANKQETKEALITAALDLSNKLKAFATVTKNKVLLGEVETTVSKLRALADTSLLDKATLFYNRAQTNVGNLTAYNVTAATQTAFTTLLANYKNLIPAPRLSQTDRKEATKNLNAAFAEADSALETMDTLVEIVRLSQTQFYSKYHSARTVINFGSKKVALNGKATSANGEPMPNVLFVLSSPSTLRTASGTAEATVNIEKKTSKKGIFRLASLPSGPYQVTVSKPGYKTQTITHHQVEGEVSKLAVVLEAE